MKIELTKDEVKALLWILPEAGYHHHFHDQDRFIMVVDGLLGKLYAERQKETHEY